MSASLTPRGYVTAIRAALDDLPEPHGGFRPDDRRLALELHRRGVPIEILRTAIRLATLRRLLRDPALPRLAPVRSLRYYLPVLDELLRTPPDPAWLHYIAARVARLTPRLREHLDPAAVGSCPDSRVFK
ncbi:MAG TPA: hypothetical protein PLL76_23885 [Thermoanaerobaculia bacterium]|jgi:hypothetical protein|nr:hypothetical protein [Thermoanaerobaculia bacterium]